MAGELYIESISADDIENILRCGGDLVQAVFHSDKSNFAILHSRLDPTVTHQNRKNLPAHCYIRFDRNNVTQAKLLRLSRILQQTTRPAGIVSTRQGLAGWDQLTDIEKSVRLYEQTGLGAVTLEFYRVGIIGVASVYTGFQMVMEQVHAPAAATSSSSSKKAKR